LPAASQRIERRAFHPASQLGKRLSGSDRNHNQLQLLAAASMIKDQSIKRWQGLPRACMRR
jgi:hypothetical protein